MGILDPMPNTKATRRPKSGKSRTSKIKPREESSKEVTEEIVELNQRSIEIEPITAPEGIPAVESVVRNFSWKQGTLVIMLLVILLLAGFAYKLFKLTTQNIGSEDGTPILEQLNIMIGGEDRLLKGEEDDRINVLLLGIGGEGHDGGTLTDSIMIASIKPSTHQVALISLPRDLIVKIYDDNNPKLWEGRKINLAYELGGPDLAVEKVSEVTGLDIHYYSLIDFSGFKKMIDDIDGIDVEVDRSFTGLYGAQELSVPCPVSQKYHLEDGDYCAIGFQRGVETMDGERALIFSRVRKLAAGSLNTEEGGDFARAQRQQKVLESFKEKLFSSETLIKPTRITTVLDSLGSHIETDMELWEIAKFLQLTADVEPDGVASKVVDNSPDGLVYTTIAEQTGASVVVPRAGDYNYSEIQRFADGVFEYTDTVQEDSTVQVLNGTATNGLAAKTAELLSTYDVDVIDVGNALDSRQTETRIYDLTGGKKANSLKLLLDVIGGKEATNMELNTLKLSDPDQTTIDTSADFIVILGKDLTEINDTEL